MIILRFRVDEFTEFALLVLLAAVDCAGIVVAGLAHHVDLTGRLNLFDDLFDLLNGAGDRYSAVDMLAGIQRLQNHRRMQMTLSEDADAVEILAIFEHIVEGGIGARNAEILCCRLHALGHEVADGNLLHIGMILEQTDEAAGEAAEADDTDTNFHSCVSFQSLICLIRNAVRTGLILL